MDFRFFIYTHLILITFNVTVGFWFCFRLLSVKNKLTENLSKEFFKNQISFINSDYGNSRHVSYRCNLDAGRYLLMATTYEPGEESGINDCASIGTHTKKPQLLIVY